MSMSLDDDREGSGGLGVGPLIGIAALVLVIGLGIGGAFAIGLQIGRGQTEVVEEPPPLAITAGQPATEEIAPGQFVTNAPGGEIPPAAIQRLRAEGASEAEIAAIRAEFAGFQGGQQGFPQGRPGFVAGTRDADATGIGTRLTGTIQSIDGDVITLMTPAGPQRISTISGTRITITQTGDIDDLTVGDRVTIAAVPGPEPDVLEAASITSVSTEE